MKSFKNCTRIAVLLGVSLLAVACKDTEVYDPDAEKPGSVKHANTFDFSTIQTVNLTVDYSSFKTYGQVFFSVYNENPFVGEGEDGYLDQSILPLYEDFTDSKGKFSMNVKLPAYAKHLYIVTGNFFVSNRLIEVDVENGAAKAVATNTNNKPATTRAAVTRSGELTNDISKLPHLSYLVEENGTVTNQRIYKDWLTPLGSWDSQSGAPAYLVDKNTIDPKLILTEAEIEGLYGAIGDALDANWPCNDKYRNQPDLTLEKSSEVTITMLGGSTCWNNSLGYYYYLDGQQPTSPEDLNIIMLFPNTQDGQWMNIKSNMSYQGNIGVQRGDAVQLMYYPNIASGDLVTGATTVFPKGIKIGFILKTHGWGMQGPAYQIKGFNDSPRKYNVWSTSTDGASYCAPFGQEGVAPYQYCNPEGLSRSAKFAYIDENGEKYAVVSFEDACNDQDYDDVIFALKPVSSFTPLPEIEEKTTTTFGVYAFEDLWPSQGDYDMNDVVVDFKHQVTSSRQKNTQPWKIYQERFILKTYQNYVELTSGLALTLNTQKTPSSIVLKKILGGTDDVIDGNFKVEGNVYYLTDDVKGEIGTTYIIELNYDGGLNSGQEASVQPFIYREEGMSNWEVHIPFEAPTAKMNYSYFGKDDDASVPSEGKYFVRESEYPFAFFLYGARVSSFEQTILKRSNESMKISSMYDGFLQWSTTNGAQRADWYINAGPNQ